MNSIIDIINLDFSYKDKKVFHNFNLNIAKGSFVSLIGLSGSGKTTLIKLLIGLLNYDGYINIDGYVVNDYFLKEIRRKISVVLTDTTFVSETVIDDLVFSLENLQYSVEEIKRLVSYIAKLFKIENLLELDPNLLNNSQKQKILIASAIISNPKILILDNVLHQLTPKDKKEVFKILKKYQLEHKMTIIFTTNDIEDTLYSDRIIVLNKGSIYLDDSPKNVFKEEEKFQKLGINRPFVVELSANLKLYNLVDDISLDMEALVDDIWK